jgi:hypothetical protein
MTADAPPRFADPRRTGALIGLAGAAVFVFSYTPAGPLPLLVRWGVVAVIAAALWFLFVRPRSLGPFVPPSRVGIAVYLACVAGELALIAVGTRLLESAGAGELRPALIALVVGLHFLPFSWAFHERMFALLGGLLVLLGALGLLTGAAEALAVASGAVMALLLLAYSLGAFARRR